MFVEASELDPEETYQLLVGSVVPRPIAWITSGRPPKPLNLAPFSAFTWVSQHPAMLGFTANRRSDGLKDTVRNIEEDGQFVVNIADDSLLDELHASSAFLDAHVSEAEALGLPGAPSTMIDVPRLARAPISMECVHERTVEFSPTGGQFVVGGSSPGTSTTPSCGTDES
ncbi:flavin reductase family protein [Agromyces aerolatus]|uniref:flavin reductase family protein n=1 Tax=Agromyces sp. LY-1074 TaxID=3074080 RepID=UPI002863DB5C|nr:MULTISPECIES: flavin reductase family protein [unclassified Agromyces]MDR5701898.1 flavin reductase family protein [Agromyces sp. LY-1074]MDR5708134.1 flavin reductase family protein [Agromyces sp. LY-1358]